MFCNLPYAGARVCENPWEIFRFYSWELIILCEKRKQMYHFFLS